MQPKIVFVSNFSLGMPADRPDEIKRDNLFQSIDKYFSNGKKVIFVEGDQELGKTVFLKQFTLYKENVGLSSFLSPFNTTSPDVYEIITDLSTQIYWLINKTELPNLGEVNLDFYRRLLIELKRQRKRNSNENYYFIIDGLDCYSKDANRNFIKGLFEIL